jgi:hypothetical protein
MATWADTETARKLWRDAPADDAVLVLYLSAAREACLAFAPLPEDDDSTGGYGEDPYGGYGGGSDIPDRYLLAQVMQARNSWNSGKASPSDGVFDGSGFGIGTAPLDWQVKQLLRPQRALGAIA